MTPSQSRRKTLKEFLRGPQGSLRNKLVVALRGDRGSVAERFWHFPLQRLRVAMMAWRGTSWMSYYAEFLDRQHRGLKSVYQLGQDHLEAGGDHLDYLRREGLKPSHSLLDFGCGVGRSAQYFIDYLEAGNYVGVDISEAKLRLASELIERRGLTAKRPQFIQNQDLTFDWLAGRRFDYVWAHSVFNHMPEGDIRVFFRNAGGIVHEDFVFLFTFIEPPDKQIRRRSIKDWSRPHEWYRDLCADYRFDCAVLGEWPYQDNQTGHGEWKKVLRVTMKH